MPRRDSGVLSGQQHVLPVIQRILTTAMSRDAAVDLNRADADPASLAAPFRE